jgi:hypothetical protein
MIEVGNLGAPFKELTAARLSSVPIQALARERCNAINGLLGRLLNVSLCFAWFTSRGLRVCNAHEEPFDLVV